VVIESFLQGTELTVLALVSGQDFVILPAAQDHKAVFEGDRGPNTGGMGAYSPVPMLDAMTEQMILERIVHPTLQGLQQEGIHYQGVLYFGLMLTEQGPQVIEYNVRFGDPETQVILPRVQTDLLALMQACVEGRLSAMQVDVSSQACAAVIMAAPGYPASYEKGLSIDGIELAAEAGCLVFQAGTQKADQQLVSAGGRILAVAALGEDLAAALEQAYAGIAKITIPGAHYRRDIGQRALQA
jgi:phosphoribosylamine--glycine ligase